MRKTDKEKIKTWFVTGASSGVGHEMCKQLLERGYNVIAVSRRVPDFKANNVLCLSVDVTEPDSIKNAIDESLKRFGRIDVLVNNAGVSSNIICEEETLEHMKKTMDTNFFGTFNTINAILPHFRENKNGTIINNTSMHGLSIRYGGSAYCSSKHAVEGLTDVIRLETSNFCRVMAFELGFFSGTDIGKNSQFKTNKLEYQNIKEYYKNILCYYDNQLSLGVKFIIEEAEKETMQRRLILGKDACFKVRTEIAYLKEDLKKSKSRAYKCSKFNKTFPLRVIRKIVRVVFKKEIFKDI